MGPRKLLPNEKTLEELLEVAEDSNIEIPEDSVSVYTNDIVPFLSFYDLKPGKDVVLYTFLYNLYKSWSKNPVRRRDFQYEVAKYLLKHQKGTRLYYMINKNSFNLSKEAYKLIQDQSFDKTKSPRYKEHFENFLNFYKITKGAYWVESFVLYSLYDKWAYRNKKNNPLGERQFFNFCCLYFEHKRRTADSHQWFALNPELKEYISDEMLKNLREARHDKKKK